jgi:hypothetical protein
LNYDGYHLYNLLKDGAETTLFHEGSTYKLLFRGTPFGSDNYLAATNQDGEEKKFGWGWGSEQVWQALAHLQRGWNSKQTPPFSPYNEAEEAKGTFVG